MGDETLQDLLLQRLAHLQGDRGGRRLSLRQVALRSFGRVSEATLRAILAGHPAVQLTDREINGLALALEVPAERVYLAAANPTTWPPRRFNHREPADRAGGCPARSPRSASSARRDTRAKTTRNY
jgi:hypothetical protein